MLLGLLFLFLHTSFHRVGGLIIVVLVLALAELVFEIIQFTGHKKRYLTDFWNWLDVFRIMFTIAYFVIFWI